MSTLAIDSLGPWGFVLLALYLIAALIYLAFFYGAGTAEREQRAAERLEVDGPFDELVARREERIKRANWRHSTRHSRRAS